MIKGVIFDLDGTLVDTVYDLAGAMNICLERHNMPTHPIDIVKTFIGNGIKNLVRLAIPEEQRDELTDVIYEEFCEVYSKRLCVDSRVFDGMDEILCKLAKLGIKTGVVSNKHHDNVVEILKYYFPNHTFDAVLGFTDRHPRKPAPDSTLEVLDKMGLCASDVVFVGDSRTDAQTAQNAGISCIIVTWGYTDDQFLQDFNRTVANSDELFKKFSN